MNALDIEKEMKILRADKKGNLRGKNRFIDRITSLHLQELEIYKQKYEKCISTIKKFDAGIIGMYDL